MGYRERKYIVSTICCVMIGALTLSKTFFISLIIIITIVLLVKNKNITIGKQIAIKGGIIFLAIIAVYILQEIYPSYLDNLLGRVDSGDITTGRVSNAMIYLSYLSKNVIQLLFGVGLQDVGRKIGFTGSPHAAIIEALVAWGIVGTIIIIGIMIYSVNQYKKKNNRSSYLAYIPLVMFIVIVQSTQLFRLRDRVFGIVVVIAMVGIEVTKGKTKVIDKRL